MSKPLPRKKIAKRVTRGSHVTFTLGGSTVTAVVIDDHGPLGPGGVHLLRVRVLGLDDVVEPFEGDVREDFVTPVYAAAS